jgi:FMN-dependent oxidoreductase (nitrilotriacetate monooxygenase family)
MQSRKENLSLGVFVLFTGHHVAAWRSPDASDGQTLADFVRVARICEEAKFDALFLGDMVGVSIDRLAAASRKAHNGVFPFEPLTLLSALATVTSRIGLVATVSTSFNEPFNAARQFASLDRLSGGRAGWNLVTSTDTASALNFDRDVLDPHAERYARASEFADVVCGLWDSWDGDAFVRDRKSGLYFDPDKLHVLNHQGNYFRVRGPLNIPPSPQGRPVLVQAGSSEAGKELAARTAEVIFTAQQTLEEAIAFYSDIKGRLSKYGREANEVKILPGVFPVVGKTESEARAKFDELQSLVPPEVGLDLLATFLGAPDILHAASDGPLPELQETEGSKSRQALLVKLAQREGLSVRDLYLRIAGARGHWQVVGTPVQIADQLEERFQNYGADGFNIMAPTLPTGLTDFVQLIVPELRRRGLVREEYEGSTLRKHLGLSTPQRAAITTE